MNYSFYMNGQEWYTANTLGIAIERAGYRFRRDDKENAHFGRDINAVCVSIMKDATTCKNFDIQRDNQVVWQDLEDPWTRFSLHQEGFLTDGSKRESRVQLYDNRLALAVMRTLVGAQAELPHNDLDITFPPAPLNPHDGRKLKERVQKANRGSTLFTFGGRNHV